MFSGIMMTSPSEGSMLFDGDVYKVAVPELLGKMTPRGESLPLAEVRWRRSKLLGMC